MLQALIFFLYIPGLILLAGWISNPRLTPWAMSESWSLASWIYEGPVRYSGSPSFWCSF